jgi:hypothetical protein
MQIRARAPNRCPSRQQTPVRQPGGKAQFAAERPKACHRGKSLSAIFDQRMNGPVASTVSQCPV